MEVRSLQQLKEALLYPLTTNISKMVEALDTADLVYLIEEDDTWRKGEGGKGRRGGGERQRTFNR